MRGSINPADLLEFGNGLRRPECVLCLADGRAVVPDWSGRGGVAIIDPDGGVGRVSARDRDLRPNGIALEPSGACLVAHLGEETGGVYRLTADGATHPIVTEIDGRALPPTNFVLRDVPGPGIPERLWITVSTCQTPRAKAYRADITDGFIAVVADGQARIVADQLGYANECAVSPDGSWLYLNETFQRRLSRFAIREGPRLGPRETVATFGMGDFPDGLTIDAKGGLWITSIVSNRVIRIDPNGERTTLLEDCAPDHLAWVETAYERGEIGRPHLDSSGGRFLHNVSSLAFGGPDLKTVWMGNLLGDRLLGFRSPIAGRPPTHWRYQFPNPGE